MKRKYFLIPFLTVFVTLGLASSASAFIFLPPPPSDPTPVPLTLYTQYYTQHKCSLISWSGYDNVHGNDFNELGIKQTSPIEYFWQDQIKNDPYIEFFYDSNYLYDIDFEISEFILDWRFVDVNNDNPYIYIGIYMFGGVDFGEFGGDLSGTGGIEWSWYWSFSSYIDHPRYGTGIVSVPQEVVETGFGTWFIIRFGNAGLGDQLYIDFIHAKGVRYV